MTTATIDRTPLEPLTAAHHQQLALARDRARPVRTAARVATFNTWVTGIFAVLSAPFAPFSVTGFLVTLGLAAIAYNECRGRRRLLEFDPSAATILAWNQLAFLALIIVYCVWMLYCGLAGDSPLLATLAANPDLQAAGVDVAGLNEIVRWCVIAVYGTVIVLSIFFQGSNALYYFTRRKYIARYVAETPAWIRDMNRAIAPV